MTRLKNIAATAFRLTIDVTLAVADAAVSMWMWGMVFQFVGDMLSSDDRS